MVYDTGSRKKIEEGIRLIESTIDSRVEMYKRDARELRADLDEKVILLNEIRHSGRHWQLVSFSELPERVRELREENKMLGERLKEKDGKLLDAEKFICELSDLVLNEVVREITPGEVFPSNQYYVLYQRIMSLVSDELKWDGVSKEEYEKVEAKAIDLALTNVEVRRKLADAQGEVERLKGELDKLDVSLHKRIRELENELKRKGEALKIVRESFVALDESLTAVGCSECL